MRAIIGENIRDFKIVDKIGSGAFAEVFKARCLQDGYYDVERYVAIKRISKNDIFKKKCQHRIKNEIKIHSELKHPAIVKFLASYEDENYWYHVLELCGGGTFEEFLKRKKHLSEEEACPLIEQVIDGVKYLHLNQIIHRDLSLRNILLTKDENVKIADFGLAVKCGPNEKKTSVLGTANFMSPEVFTHEPYDFKVDTWGVGCILYALLYGAPPFDGKKRSDIEKGTVESELTFPDCASIEAIELLNDMLQKKPKNRIKIKDALQYAFFLKFKNSNEKYKSNNQKSGDSGMSSLSGSGSATSRSNRKMKGTFDIERKNNYGNKVYSEKYSYEFSNSQGSPRPEIQDDSNSGYQRRNSPCKPKLKISAPGSANQLKNKLQLSRKDKHLSSRMYPETREHDCEDRQWVMRNKRNYERGTFNNEYPLESQVEAPIKYRPESPSYPPYLQNQTQENLALTSYNSDYNEVENNKKYECIDKQRNIITRPNSEDNILKHCCSHDQYCLPEKKCPPKSSSYCCQNAALVKRNSHSDHHSCKGKNKPDLEIRNFTAEKGLYSGLTPLTTVRLKPNRHATKNAIVSILNDGQVCIEFLKLKKKKSYVTNVCYISCDGLKISIFKPKKKSQPSEKPPSLPNNIEEVEYYSFENLPEMHWKKYQYAKRFVDIVRAKTPKVIMYEKEAKFVVMDNAPCPDFEMKFYDGYQITEIKDKIAVMDQNGIHLTDEKIDAHIEFLLNTFKKMKEKWCMIKADVENLSKVMDSLSLICFPLIFGGRPNPLHRNLDDSKENASPRSMYSSALNGTVAMKSYSGTINTDCSPCTNSSPASMPSPLSNRKGRTTEKNITDDVPALKRQPSVVNGWVTADYKDGIQMKISGNQQDVFFYDVHTKQRLSSDEHPELMKRYRTYLSSALLYALSDVQKTK